MRKSILLSLLAVALVSNLHAEERRPEMGRYTAAYSGGEGYRVWVARIGSKESQEVLVQIFGIDHKLDGRVVRAKIVGGVGGGSVKYVATVDGQSYELLHVEADRALLRVTGAPWPAELRYDKDIVDDRPPQHLLTDYLETPRQKK